MVLQVEPAGIVPEAKQLKGPVGTSSFGNVVPYSLIEGPQVWYGRDVKDETHWIHHLTPEHIAELDAAVAAVEPQVKTDGNYIVNLQDVIRSKDDFPIPSLSTVLETVLHQVSSKGQGFSLIKGLPIDRWTRLQTLIAYYGISRYWGTVAPQNEKNHLIGHVKDTGVDPEHKNLNTRIYLTRVAQPWHVDASDVAALLTLKTAKEGGRSGLVSSVALHNEVLKRRPDLLQALVEGEWVWASRNMSRAGHQVVKADGTPLHTKPYIDIPVFNYINNNLVSTLSPHSYRIAEATPGIPKLSPLQKEALQFVVDLLNSEEEGLSLFWYLEPGDLQLVNNLTNLHTRSAYTDHEDPALKRHLVRLWLSLDPENTQDLAGSVYDETPWAAGPDGRRVGLRYAGVPFTLPMEAETPY